MYRFACAILVLVVVSSLNACSVFAVAFAPDRVASPSTTASAEGRQLLDDALREGAYEQLPEVIGELTRLAIENPRDGELHTALGMAHLWRVSERPVSGRSSLGASGTPRLRCLARRVGRCTMAGRSVHDGGQAAGASFRKSKYADGVNIRRDSWAPCCRIGSWVDKKSCVYRWLVGAGTV